MFLPSNGSAERHSEERIGSDSFQILFERVEKSVRSCDFKETFRFAKPLFTSFGIRTTAEQERGFQERAQRCRYPCDEVAGIPIY